MTRLFALSALIPALMTSTALAADVLAEPVVVEDVPIYALTGSFGLGGFWMPEFDDGLFAGGTDDPLFGGIATVSGSVTTGTYNDWDIILGFNLIGGFASDDSSSSQSFGGQGTVFISGLSTPGGESSITLNTANDLTADVTISPPPPGDPVPGENDSKVDISGGTTSGAAVALAEDGSGFVIGVATVDGGRTAFGAIADVTGGIAVITGNLDGLEITTNTSRDLFYTGADLTIGLGNASYGGAAVSVYTGPSYRGLFQDTDTDVTIDLAEVGEGLTLPDFTISSEEDLDSHYFGGILGGTASWGIGTGMIFSIGLEGGVYGVSASWRGHDTYSTGGGVFDDPNTEDVEPITQLPVTVEGADLDLDDIDDGTIAFAARGNAAITWAVSENQAISLGGSLEYLSQVATVTHDRVSDPAYDNGASWTPGDPPTGAPSVSWGSMVNFAITASWTGTF
ncbi:hypothetical protein PRN20_06860 [Devosia sp. ZB163]|uniref:hypothetical protein n=1 Tax=Devosia sp. ZB163 TaxID=3025938 RepID=UPI0023625A45|nr:hypothetical protein [Devosia sp. ZB163]MDC9823448.1 hypothetical protein [Devosia sp. ZB163]